MVAMVVTISSRTALLCFAALATWCFATAAGAVPPSRPSEQSPRPAGRVPKEYPCGREGRQDRHLCSYEVKVRMVQNGEISLSPPLSAYPEDPSISGAVQWFNISSDQLPMSLAASPGSNGPIFVVRGSMRVSRNPFGSIQISSTPGSAELLRLSAANGAVSTSRNISSFGNPQRFAVDADGNPWIADRTSAEVVKIRGNDYSRVLSVGGPPCQTANGSSRLCFCLPIDVAAANATSTDGSGRAVNFIYVVDSTSPVYTNVPKRDQCVDDGGRVRPSRIVRFDASSGAYVDSFNVPPDVVGQVRLSIDRRQDRLYVADYETGRIYTYGAGLRAALAAAYGGRGGEPFGRRLDIDAIAVDGKIVDMQAHPARDQLYVVTVIGVATERFTFGFTIDVSQPTRKARWTPPSQPYGFYSFSGLAIDSSGSAMYAADDDGATTRLWKFNIL